MPRPVAASTGLSLAIHAIVVAALVGVRFEASERATFGVVEVEWFVLDDRIDAGTSSGSAGAAVLADAPVEQVIPGNDAMERADVVSVASPPAEPSAGRAVEAPPPVEGASPSRSVDEAAARSPPPVETVPQPPPPVEIAAPPRRAASRPRSRPASPRPEAAVMARVDIPVPDVLATTGPNPVLTASAAAGERRGDAVRGARAALRSAALPDTRPPADAADGGALAEPAVRAFAEPPVRDDPLVDEVEALSAKLASLDGAASGAPATLRFEHDGDEYTATFTPVPAADDTSLDRMIVAVSTERDGDRRSTEMRFRRIAFSSYAQFVDRWDPAVQIHDDEIDGRFHANSEIYVDTSRGVKPVFHGRVTTSRGVSTSGRAGRFAFRRGDVFVGGLETRIPRIALPSEVEPFAAIGDGSAVHRFGVGTRITFHAGGTYVSVPLDGTGPERRRPLSSGTVYLLADGDAALHVSGVVDGRVLVHSSERIVVEGDLVYAADPDAPGADDYLGLVSDGNVEVAEPDVTGPGDLEIHAAIYAKRRFVVRSYRARELATLSIVGSVTAGSLTASEPRYRTRVRFDRRFENGRPPGFPMTERYELADWDGHWATEPSTLPR